MMIIGALLMAWGIAVLLVSRPLHTNWREMIATLRRAGLPDRVWFTEWVASAAGLRQMRIAGGFVLAVGLVLLALGGFRALS